MTTSPSWSSEHDASADYYKSRKVSDSLAPQDSYLVHHDHRTYPSYEQVTNSDAALAQPQAYLYPSQANLVAQSHSQVDLHGAPTEHGTTYAPAGTANHSGLFQPQNPRGHSSKMFGLNLGMSNRMPAALYTVLCGYFTA